MTPFKTIEDFFFGKVTDDMYMEMTEEDTRKDILNIFRDSIARFEFPRFDLYDFDEETCDYNCDLTIEEINIIALCMLMNWIQRQITSIENTRQKFSGSDFKLTSQANHLAKLLDLKKDIIQENVHMQRLYKRRKQTSKKGTIESNWSSIMEKSALDG